MEILNPVAWFLMFLVFPLIAIFLIRPGYRREVVSTMIFWEDTCRGNRFAAWCTRFRGLISFLFACAFVLILIGALLNPIPAGPKADSRVIMIDCSTSEDIRMYPIGQGGNNIAITKCEVRRQASDPMEYELLIEATNYGTCPVEVPLSVELNGVPVYVSCVELVPDKPEIRFVRGVSGAGGKFRVALECESSGRGMGDETLNDVNMKKDILAADNVCETILPPWGHTRVLIFGEADSFLVKAIRSQPFVTLETITELPDTVPADTVLVIEGNLPRRLPKGNIFIVDPKGRCDLFASEESLDLPVVENAAVNSPITRHVSLRGMTVPGSRRIVWEKSGPKPDVLASTIGSEPLLTVWNRPGGSVIVFAAKPSQGELVFRISFPLMIANILNVCRGSRDDFRFSSSLAARLARIRASDLRNVAATGENIVKPVLNGTSTHSTDTIAGTNTIAETNAMTMLRTGSLRYPLWFYFGWLALGVSVAEWFFYHRRWME